MVLKFPAVAGTGPVLPVEEYPMGEFDRVVAVHLRAAFIEQLVCLGCTNEAWRDLKCFQHFRESGVQLGIGVRRRKSGTPRAYAIQRGGSGAQRRSRKRDLPGPVTEPRRARNWERNWRAN